MVFDIVKMILGELPPQFEFVYSFGIVFVLYIFLKIFKLFIDFTLDLLRGYNMLDLVVFIAQQFFNMIMFFDNFTIIGSLSLLRLLIISLLIIFVYQFLGGKNMINDFVPFISEHYTEYEVLINIYQLLFIYCFVQIVFKGLTFLNRK